MNDHQKQKISEFEKRLSFFMGKAGKSTLNAIITSSFKFANPRDTMLPDYKNDVHPWDYYNYVIQWELIHDNKIPNQFDGDRMAFARYVIDEWHKICYKEGFYKYDLLSGVFDNYSTLTATEAQLLKECSDNGITVRNDSDMPDYQYHIEQLYERGQRMLDEQNRRTQDELERLERDRQEALGNGKSRHAEHLQAEANRLRADAEAKALARQNREFQNRANSPWSSSVATNTTATVPAASAAGTKAIGTSEGVPTPSSPSIPIIKTPTKNLNINISSMSKNNTNNNTSKVIEEIATLINNEAVKAGASHTDMSLFLSFDDSGAVSYGCSICAANVLEDGTDKTEVIGNSKKASLAEAIDDVHEQMSAVFAQWREEAEAAELRKKNLAEAAALDEKIGGIESVIANALKELNALKERSNALKNA